ncbi:MAG TPA: L-threonylcarbamoyladenylate synthase [Alphaproteobacteria bacterium]|nr:L-threonylcarbamoyladenylate synthase [Alphaproteobacteria bacterium]
MFENQLQPWLKALKSGQVAAAPAEGVYGYVADPFDGGALEKLLALKQRSPSKGLIVLIPNLENLNHLCPRNLPVAAQIAVSAYWGGAQSSPVTLILPALKSLPETLTGGKGTVAVRCPAMPYMQEYLQAWGGPLVSTSLNISGEAPATSASQVPQGIAALTLPQPLSGMPSRIFDTQTNSWLR